MIPLCVSDAWSLQFNPRLPLAEPPFVGFGFGSQLWLRPLDSLSSLLANTMDGLRGIRTSRTSGSSSSLELPRSDDPDLEDSGGVRHNPTETPSKSIGLNSVSLLASSPEEVLSEGDGVIPLGCGSSAALLGWDLSWGTYIVAAVLV